MLKLSYDATRNLMRPGDVIALGSKGHLSDLIKWGTRSNVSHVGIVFETHVNGGDGRIVDIMESTTLYEDPETGKRVAGVQRNRLSRRLKYEEGEAWWLPLSDEARARLDVQAMTNFLLHHDEKEYDMVQALQSGLDLGTMLGQAKEDFSSFFCSELVSAALEAGGVIKEINASEVTPADMCMFNLYAKEYVLLQGEEKRIKGYNSLSPTGFGM